MEGVEIGNISLPLIKGDKGDKGDAGKILSMTITMLASTATPTVTNTGTQTEAQYILGIPRGTGISSAVINEDGELVITLTDNTELNLGVIVPTSITSVTIDSNYDFVVTYSDGTEVVVGNLGTVIENLIAGELDNYYDKTTADGKFSLITETGNKIDVSINTTTYVMTLQLKDKNNNVLSTGTVDLPLESVVVNGAYNSQTKKIVLTLQNGNTIEFSVADLVSGLQSEITSNNKLSADLVDDTNTTHKFVTATEKTAIGTIKTDYAHTITLGYTTATHELEIGIANYNGTVLDTGSVDFDDILTDYATETYVDNAVSGLQSEITSTNKLSADLVDDTNATHKFVTSTEKTKIANSVSNTDYASDTGTGVIRALISKGLSVGSNGALSCSGYPYSMYTSLSTTAFISKATLDNVLAEKIGNINSVLDAINGEVI